MFCSVSHISLALPLRSVYVHHMKSQIYIHLAQSGLLLPLLLSFLVYNSVFTCYFVFQTACQALDVVRWSNLTQHGLIAQRQENSEHLMANIKWWTHEQEVDISGADTWTAVLRAGNTSSCQSDWQLLIKLDLVCWVPALLAFLVKKLDCPFFCPHHHFNNASSPLDQDELHLSETITVRT